MRQPVEAVITLPGSKSITNRALLCAALADGTSRLYGALHSDDTKVMIAGLRKMGIAIEDTGEALIVRGRSDVLGQNDVELYLGNAGTATRFLTAAAVARPAVTTITGDERMQERPIADLVDGLRQIGTKIVYLDKADYPPIRISPIDRAALGSEVCIRMRGDRSSQYFSAIMMTAPLLGRPLRLEVIGDLVSKPYIDITIGVMRAFGIDVVNDNYTTVTIRPQVYRATDFAIEGDASAATYFMALQFLHGGTVDFANLEPETSIQGDADFASALARVGCGEIDMNRMPDAAMTLAVAAPFVAGSTTVANVANLRIKETDRLSALACELRRVGAATTTTSSSITITGTYSRHRHVAGADDVPAVPKPANVVVDTYNDHRMAMCFAVFGTVVPGITLANPHCTSKTYPQFFDDLERTYLHPVEAGDRHVVLTGMRGAGKSFLGPGIARHLGRAFVDVDEAIEAGEGRAITEIVRDAGWDEFRTIERAYCGPPDAADVSIFRNASGPLVIATGGGVVLSDDVMRFLRSIGIVIFVFADPRVLASRILDCKKRPALHTSVDLATEISRVWLERRSRYLTTADYVWDNTGGTVVQANLERVFL